MSNIYLKDTISLCKTMVIKDQLSADLVNEALLEVGESVDLSDPTTWRYYKHLAGDYHTTDVPMFVTSLDTMETIPFTKEALNQHRATRRSYVYGTQYYNDLVREFPKQEELILGIVNPVDLQTAVSAPDHTILWYDPALVEYSEIDLITHLQQWVDSWFRRWSMDDYRYAHDLYQAAHLGVFYLKLVEAVLNLRLEAARTNQAHSFHIWSYLGSHQRLDFYRDYLNTWQQQYFYRDIAYLERHAGRISNFSALIEAVMTERGLPLAEYHMRHNVSNIPTELHPTIELIQHPVNMFESVPDTKITKSVLEILEQEIPLAKDNHEELGRADERINYQMRNNIISRVPTKVLESEVMDISSAQPVTLSDVLFNHWIYWSVNRLYTTVLTIQNPFTAEIMSMPVKDAFLVWLYCYNKTQGFELVDVPWLKANGVQLTQQPRFEDLRSIAEPKYISDRYINLTMDGVPVVTTMVSTEVFYNKAYEIFERKKLHRLQYTSMERYESRGQGEAVCGRIYGNVSCVFEPDGTTFDQFFAARGWYIADLSLDDTDLLANEILKTATGMDLHDTKSVQEIQAAMIRLLLQLSSYSIQVIQTVNAANAAVLDWPVIRVGDTNAHGEGDVKVEIADIGPIAEYGRGHAFVELPIDDWFTFSYSETDYASYWQSTKLWWGHHNGETENQRGLLSKVRFHRVPKTPLPDVVTVTGLNGIPFVAIDPVTE